MQLHSVLPLGLTLVFVSLIGNSSTLEQIIVNTVQGKVQGFRSIAYSSNIDSFLGIPFAEPPIGNLRFKHPLPVKPWQGTKKAVERPSSCYQGIDTMFDRFEGVEMWNPNTNLSEDCLYLNVWTPNYADNKKRAVMVWIYGGGFYAGSSTLDIYDGRTLAIKEDMVIVSMQYRVGPLGFSYLGDTDLPGNAGLMDQQLALNWTHENIARFGGDPNKVTIFGESAGAASVSYHLLSKGSKDYFQSAILQSGSALAWWAYHEPGFSRRRTMHLARVVCSDTKDVGKNITLAKACLMKASAEFITDKQWFLSEFYFDVPLAPTIDGKFLEKPPDEIIKKGEFKRAKLLLGSNADEGNYFLLYGLYDFYKFNITKPLTRREFHRAFNRTSPYKDEFIKKAILFEYEESKVISDQYTYRDVLDDLTGDVNFICPTANLAQFYAEKKQIVYQYSFVHRNVLNPWPKWLGVLHGYEIDYVFGTPHNSTYWPIKFNDEERALSSRMMRFWANFARYGDPNGDGGSVKQWPVYSAQTKDYIILDIQNSSTKGTSMGLRHRECTFWHKYIPYLLSHVKELPAEYITKKPDPLSTSPSQMPAALLATYGFCILFVRILV